MNRDSFMKSISLIGEENPDVFINDIFSGDKNTEALINLHSNGYLYFFEPNELDEMVFIPININMIDAIDFKKEMRIFDSSVDGECLPTIMYFYEIHLDYMIEGMYRRFSMVYSSNDLLLDGSKVSMVYSSDNFLLDGSKFSIEYEEHHFEGFSEFAVYLRNKRYLQDALNMLTNEGVLAREHETIKEHGFSLIGRMNYHNIVTLLENEFNYKNVLTILLVCPTAFYIETNAFAERIKAILSIWDSNNKNPRLTAEDFLIEDLYDRSELKGDCVLYRVGNTHDDYWNEYIDEWLPLEIQTWTYLYDSDD